VSDVAKLFTTTRRMNGNSPARHRTTTRASPSPYKVNKQRIMSAVISQIASPVAARAAVTRQSTRVTSASSFSSPSPSQRRVDIVPSIPKNVPGVRSPSRRSFRLVNAVAAPVMDAAPGGDPFSAFFAEQMLDETAMLAASTFPISPEVGEASFEGFSRVVTNLRGKHRPRIPPPNATTPSQYLQDAKIRNSISIRLNYEP